MNSQILSAIIVKWAEPLINGLAQSKLAGIPFIGNIEAKVKSTGWVSNQWSLMSELAPYANDVIYSLIGPILNQYLSKIPDESIPEIAHRIVDTAMEKGEMSLLEGYITFDKGDLMRLKKLLNANLPYSKVKPIKLKEDE